MKHPDFRENGRRELASKTGGPVIVILPVFELKLRYIKLNGKTYRSLHNAVCKEKQVKRSIPLVLKFFLFEFI